MHSCPRCKHLLDVVVGESKVGKTTRSIRGICVRCWYQLSLEIDPWQTAPAPRAICILSRLKSSQEKTNLSADRRLHQLRQTTTNIIMRQGSSSGIDGAG